MASAASLPRRIAGIRWWVAVVVVDLVLLAATALGWKVLSPIKLGAENNLATWWSGILYFLAAYKAYGFAREGDLNDRRTWLPVALGLTLLGFTEIGSIHERMSFQIMMWIVEIAAVVFAVLWAYPFLRLFRNPSTRVSALCLAGGFLAMAAARAQEFVEFSYQWTEWQNNLRTAVEEGTELIGSMLFLWSVLAVNRRGREVRLVEALPDLASLRRLRALAPLGMLGAGLLGYFAAREVDLTHRGNPASCIVVFVFLALGTFALRRWLEGGGKHLLLRALFLLAVSADIMCMHTWNFLVYYPDPGARHKLDIWYGYFTWSWVAYAAIVLLWALFRSHTRPKNWVALLAVGAVAAWCAASGSTQGTMIAAGAITCGLFLVVVPGARAVRAR